MEFCICHYTFYTRPLELLSVLKWSLKASKIQKYVALNFALEKFGLKLFYFDSTDNNCLFFILVPWTIIKIISFTYDIMIMTKYIIFLSGAKWHFRRKLLTPTFHNCLFNEYLKTAIREAIILTSCLEQNVGRPFDMVPYAKRAALDIICGELTITIGTVL